MSGSQEVVFREGVSPRRPRGTRWVLVAAETPMSAVVAGVGGGAGVWGVSAAGQALLRIGVTRANPKVRGGTLIRFRELFQVGSMFVYVFYV